MTDDVEIAIALDLAREALDELHQLRLSVDDLARAVREYTQTATRASEPALYCPPEPDRRCAGGVPLRRSLIADADPDEYFHPLPEVDWHWRDIEEKGLVSRTLVKNHNVWRSRALTWEQLARLGLTDAAAIDVPPEPDAQGFRHPGDVLTWASRTYGMSPHDVYALLQIGDAPGIATLGLNEAAERIAAHRERMSTNAEPQ